MPRNTTPAYPPIMVPDGATIHGRPAEFFGLHPEQDPGFNAQQLQACIAAGGTVTLFTPGEYPLSADAFSVTPGLAQLEIGPGVFFSIGGVRRFPSTLGPILRRKKPRALSRIMTRSLTGRSQAVAHSSTVFTGTGLSTGLTQHQRVALAAPFDAVRIGIPNMHTAAIANVIAAVGVTNALGAWATTAPTANNTGAATAAAPTPSETVSASPGAFRRLTFNGAQSVSLPAAIDASNLVPSVTWSDWCPVASVPRTDGGTFPLLDVRVFIPTASGFVSIGYNGASNSAWAVAGRDDLYTGGRAYRCWNQDTDGVTTPANFTQTTTTPTVIPLLIQYRSRTDGATQLVLGDSIYDGTAGPVYPGNTFAFQAVRDAHDAAFPVEHCTLNAAGGSTIQLSQRLNAHLAQVSPAVLLLQSASINNFGTSLGSRTQQEGLGTVGVGKALADAVGAALIVGSMFPVTNAARNWAATDSQRTTLNAAVSALAALEGFEFLDFGQVLDGPPVSGQVEPLASTVAGDGFHLNDTGHTAAAALALAALRRAMFVDVR